MVVQQHFATLRHSRQRQDGANVSAGYHPRRLDNAVLVHRSHETHLPPTRKPYGRANPGRGGPGETAGVYGGVGQETRGQRERLG